VPVDNLRARLMSAPDQYQRGPGRQPPTVLPMTIETCRELAGGADAVTEIVRAIVPWTEPAEKRALAIAALQALPRDEGEVVAEAYLEEARSAPPRLWYENILAEARVWAGAASGAQLRAYLAACFSALAPGPRLRFVIWAVQQLSSEALDRVFLAIWEMLDDAKRRDFIKQVTTRRRVPEGRP
jgi:hypothetical protein